MDDVFGYGWPTQMKSGKVPSCVPDFQNLDFGKFIYAFDIHIFPDVQCSVTIYFLIFSVDLYIFFSCNFICVPPCFPKFNLHFSVLWQGQQKEGQQPSETNFVLPMEPGTLHTFRCPCPQTKPMAESCQPHLSRRRAFRRVLNCLVAYRGVVKFPPYVRPNTPKKPTNTHVESQGHRAGAIAISNFNQKTAGWRIQTPSVADAVSDGGAQGKRLGIQILRRGQMIFWAVRFELWLEFGVS